MVRCLFFLTFHVRAEWRKVFYECSREAKAAIDEAHVLRGALHHACVLLSAVIIMSMCMYMHRGKEFRRDFKCVDEIRALVNVRSNSFSYF